MNIIALIEGIISSVPEAIKLWQLIAPHITSNADIPQDVIDKVNAMAPIAHEVVDDAHRGIQLLLDTHKLTSM